jgi:sulfur carrier protein
MHENITIGVVIDGLREEIPAGTSLGQLLEHRGEPLKVAMIEHNGVVVPRGDLRQVVLEDGDRIEVILPAFGG